MFQYSKYAMVKMAAGINTNAFGTKMNVIELIAPMSNRPRATVSNPNSRNEVKTQLTSLITTILIVTFVLAKTLIKM